MVSLRGLEQIIVGYIVSPIWNVVGLLSLNMALQPKRDPSVADVVDLIEPRLVLQDSQRFPLSVGYVILPIWESIGRPSLKMAVWVLDPGF
ncbi:hypothetical protein GGR54DRAFT_645489 [Hypoxylon sp. NC1633]|nr:hypothetical protein GGR54DRAFT_645489 [Hypoxylon sp. NC1633]